ncbi:MAG: GntR family transcriptional regulator, transcriptional repressor for pyruvate dehydrogenase complex [Gaiellales bacterium]|nr:GntR family transcriptional regulator, transcriptional repressor for pyruvate dehydrogenase complex [Gaiellales bacterium]
MTESTPTVPTFVPAQRVRSFDHIVGQIHEAIASGGIAPGERLPSERDLGVAFGVSRTTLREALRALEAQGVIEIRTGSRGGAFVAEPSSQLVAAALGALLRFRSATARELGEFRIPFEAENAAWAARRADPAALAELEHIVGDVAVRAEDDAVPWAEVAALEVRFHDAVARATGNSVRAAIMAAILDALERAFRAVPVPAGSPLRSALAPELRQITDAIHAGDDAAAGEAMRAHVARWSELEVEHSP